MLGYAGRGFTGGDGYDYGYGYGLVWFGLLWFG